MLVRNPGEPDVEPTVGQVQSEIAHAIAALMQADVPPRARGGLHATPSFEIEMLAQQLVGALRGARQLVGRAPRGAARAGCSRRMDFAWLGLERLAEGERWPGD